MIIKSTFMKKIKIASIFLFFVYFLGCSPNNPNYNEDIDKINTSNIYESIHLANLWRDTKPDITSFVSNKELIVSFPDNTIIKKSLPKDTLYIAVAPYINNTHTCSTHYISSCKGELANKIFSVTAIDENGNVLLDNQIKTLDNGFFELWMPRGLTIKLDIKYNHLSTSQIIGTFNDSKTCVTTAKLK